MVFTHESSHGEGDQGVRQKSGTLLVGKVSALVGVIDDYMSVGIMRENIRPRNKSRGSGIWNSHKAPMVT